MKYVIVMVLIVILCAHACSQEQLSGKGTLIVKITELRNNDGCMKVLLFHSADGFPNNPRKADRILDIHNLSGNACEAKFSDLQYGEYAVGAMQDENNNGKMDVGLFGIPKEGYGASNDARGFFGPPNYDDAKFMFSSDSMAIVLKMTY